MGGGETHSVSQSFRGPADGYSTDTAVRYSTDTIQSGRGGGGGIGNRSTVQYGYF